MPKPLSRFALDYLRDIAVHELGRDRFRPTFLNFSVSNRCNAKCQMCDIWRYPSSDARAEELASIFANPHLRSVRDFGITGGEPFIRSDLQEVVECAAASLPRLRQVAITTNGFNTQRIRKVLPRLTASLQGKGIDLIVTVSVDGLGEVHNRIRGVPAVWSKVEETLDYLQKCQSNGLRFGVACTISKANADAADLSALAGYMRERGIPITYRLAVYVSRIYNGKVISKCGLRPESPAAITVAGFLREIAAHARLSWRAEFYDFLIDYLECGDREGTNAARQRPLCKERRDGGMLDSNGDLYVCSVSGQRIGNLKSELISEERVRQARREVRERFCANCYHDHAIHPRFASVARAMIAKFGGVVPMART